MNVEDVGVVDGDGDRIGDYGDGDDTESGDSVNLQGVESAQLSIESQLMRPHQLSQENIPMSSRPPTNNIYHPFGDVRHRWRCGRIKVEAKNISQMQKVEMTYLERMSATQPPINHSKCSYRVIGLIRRHGRIKIEPGKLKIECLNDKTA